ncbi:MAG: ABC transporter ATP-binding protein [Gammaproteobacteria bacterium]|jgi:lipopolysaccharide transport system ATP-binding protein
MAIIEVNHITKEYRLGALHSFKQTLHNTLARLRGDTPQGRPLFKALDDIDFKVEEGEVLGIIGHNGAGKSTLLKMLARISVPTRGTITVKGKVAPLIEVGAGLVPDLTGRENIYLNGSILGMRRAEIARNFDQIVAFAELEEFIDTPIKRYSSGMQVRLGFSIATSVDADILIVDEVLAVGDLAFQRKCFDRMEQIIKGNGSTVLLVSHNIRQVQRMCTRSILLDHGRIIADGKASDVTEMFYQHSNEKVLSDQQNKLTVNRRVKTSGEVELLGIDILSREGQCIDQIESGDILRVRVKFKLLRSLEKPEIVVGTHTTDFLYLTASSTAMLDDRPNLCAGVHEIEYIVESYPLVAGNYCVRIAFFDSNRRPLFSGETLKIFSVKAALRETLEPELRKLNVQTRWRLNGEIYPTIATCDTIQMSN